MVYTLIDHRNDALKCSKLCSEITRKLQLIVQIEAKNPTKTAGYEVLAGGLKALGNGKIFQMTYTHI